MAEAQLPLTFEQAAVLSVDQLWNQATSDLLKVAKEDRRVERKPAGIHAAELSTYFSMWANTATEGGLIAVGIANNGEFVGCLCIETAHITLWGCRV